MQSSWSSTVCQDLMNRGAASCERNTNGADQSPVCFRSKASSQSTDPTENNINGGCCKHGHFVFVYFAMLMEKNLTDTNEENIETESFSFTYFQNYYKISIL